MPSLRQQSTPETYVGSSRAQGFEPLNSPGDGTRTYAAAPRTLVGAGVGAWAGSMIGVSTGNSRIKQFEAAIEAGQLLVLADVPTNRVEEIEARIKAHLPQVEIEGTEPIIPAFP